MSFWNSTIGKIAIAVVITAAVVLTAGAAAPLAVGWVGASSAFTGALVGAAAGAITGAAVGGLLTGTANVLTGNGTFGQGFVAGAIRGAITGAVVGAIAGGIAGSHAQVGRGPAGRARIETDYDDPVFAKNRSMGLNIHLSPTDCAEIGAIVGGSIEAAAPFAIGAPWLQESGYVLGPVFGGAVGWAACVAF